MKKGKKAAIIIIAVIAAAAIVVGGLMIGGVIPTGNKRTASAKEIVVDKDTITACRNHPKTYKSSLKHLYGMTPEDVEKFYENNCLLQQAFVKNGDLSVEQYIAEEAKKAGGTMKVTDFVRFEKGEGLEKRNDDFASEVANMVK